MAAADEATMAELARLVAVLRGCAACLPPFVSHVPPGLGDDPDPATDDPDPDDPDPAMATRISLPLSAEPAPTAETTAETAVQALQALDRLLLEHVSGDRYALKQVLVDALHGHLALCALTRHPTRAVADAAFSSCNRLAVNSFAGADALVDLLPDVLSHAMTQGLTLTPRYFLLVALHKARLAPRVMEAQGWVFHLLGLLRRETELVVAMPATSPVASFGAGLLFALSQQMPLVKSFKAAGGVPVAAAFGHALRQRSRGLRQVHDEALQTAKSLAAFHATRATLAYIVMLDDEADINTITADLHEDDCVVGFALAVLHNSLHASAESMFSIFSNTRPNPSSGTGQPQAGPSNGPAVPVGCADKGVVLIPVAAPLTTQSTTGPVRAFFSVAEAVLPVAAVARSKAMHAFLLQSNVLDSLAKCFLFSTLDPTLRERVLLTSTYALWNLAFSDEGKAAIAARSDVLEFVNSLAAAAPTRKIQRNCEGILFQLKHVASAAAQQTPTTPTQGSSAPTPLVSTVKTTLPRHVMLSYCWSEQKFTLWLRTELKARGYSVWMDIDQMSGSTLEAMAKAIEDAAVVVVVLSSNYKDSAACRTEAEYASQLKRPIFPLSVNSYRADGWLGAIVASHTIYHFPAADDADGQERVLERVLGEFATHGAVPVSAEEAAVAALAAQAYADNVRRQQLQAALQLAEQRAVQVEREAARLQAHVDGLKAAAAGLRLQTVLATLEARFTHVDEQLRRRKAAAIMPSLVVTDVDDS